MIDDTEVHANLTRAHDDRREARLGWNSNKYSRRTKRDKEDRLARRLEQNASGEFWCQENAEIVEDAIALTPLTFNHVKGTSEKPLDWWRTLHPRSALFSHSDRSAPKKKKNPTTKKQRDAGRSNPDRKSSRKSDRAELERGVNKAADVVNFVPSANERIKWMDDYIDLGALPFFIQPVVLRSDALLADPSARVAKGGDDSYRWEESGDFWITVLLWTRRTGGSRGGRRDRNGDDDDDNNSSDNSDTGSDDSNDGAEYEWTERLFVSDAKFEEFLAELRAKGQHHLKSRNGRREASAAAYD